MEQLERENTTRYLLCLQLCAQVTVDVRERLEAHQHLLGQKLRIAAAANQLQHDLVHRVIETFARDDDCVWQYVT